MKKTITAALALLMLSGAAGVYAATAGPATGNAQVVIIAPLMLTHNSGAKLDFGNVINTTAGTVTVAAKDGSVTTSGVTGQNGTTTADQFTVTGANGIPFTVSAPSTITVTSGANNMTINSVTSFCGTGATSSCVASSAGTAVGVGGTLAVSAAQAVGTYTGTYTLSITY